MTTQKPSNLKVKDISFINNIKSMAVIGSSKKRDFYYLRNHAENFRGDIYAVHPTVKEISGFDKNKIFSSVKDIPEDVDFVFITVPSSQLLNVMDDCAEKGVKLASIFTADLADSGTKEGIELEKELIRSAQNKVRILGPNCLGLFYPKLGITWRPKFPTTPGNIGFIAQSGGICNIAIYMGTELGINFSKVISFGNGADLDFVDVLFFMSNDPETEIIMCYVEGVKNERGKDLREFLAQNKKPIIVLKGGQTKTGSIAAKTHTASISGENHLWKAIFKQYNAIEVDSLEQLIYTAKIIDFYGLFEFNNVAIFSYSGGYGVILADLVEKKGMKIPPFSSEIQKQLDKKFFIHGTSSNNPLDVAAQIFSTNVIQEIMDLILSDNKIDGVIMDLPSFYFNVDFNYRKDYTFEPVMIETLCLGHKHNKPVIPIILRINCPEDRERVFKKLTERKVPVFGDPLEFIHLLPKISKYTRKVRNK